MAPVSAFSPLLAGRVWQICGITKPCGVIASPSLSQLHSSGLQIAPNSDNTQSRRLAESGQKRTVVPIVYF